MAIGTTAAILGAAVIGAGASAVAGSAAAKAQKAGATTAAEASERATQLQVEESRRQYDQTRGDYAPYREAGYGALSKLTEMYGLTPQTATGAQASLQQGWGTTAESGAHKAIADKAPAGVDWGAYVRNNPDAAAQWSSQTADLASFGGDINKFGAFHYQNDGARRDLTQYKGSGSGMKPATPVGQTGTSGNIPGPDYSGIGRAPTYATPDYSSFEESPGYQFRLQRGLDAVKANASARGLLGSTKTMKNINDFAEGQAADEYNAFYSRATAAADADYSRRLQAYDSSYNRQTSAYDAYANRLAAMAGVGQTATGQTASAGTQTAQTIASAYGANGQAQANAATNAANATASGYANLGSAVNSGATNLASLYLYQQNGGFGASPYNRTGMI